MKTIFRHAKRFFLFAALCFLPALICADEIIHIVANGETAYSMARFYGVKVDDILILNGIDDARKIRAGQKIKIPKNSFMASPVAGETAAEPSTQKAAKPISHRVKKGETLTGIARNYGISLSELRTVNALSQNYVLKTGDVLKIFTAPAASPAAPPAAVPSPAAKKQKPVSVPKEMLWPFTAKESSYLGGKLSPGMILTGEQNESVRSVSSGTVVSAGPYRGFGRVVIVKSDSGYDYFYGGCGMLSVRKGDRVLPGTEVGRLGISAVTLKPELTFMIYHNRTSLDPATTPRV